VNVSLVLTAQNPWLVRDSLQGMINHIAQNVLENSSLSDVQPALNLLLALEARGSYRLKAVTGITTVLFVHLAEVPWLAKVSLLTQTTSFALNAQRKNSWPTQLNNDLNRFFPFSILS